MPSSLRERSSAKEKPKEVSREIALKLWGRGLVLTLLSAALFVLCFPGRPLPWLAWIAVVPLICELRVAMTFRGFLLSYLFGWLIWFTSVWWLHAPLRDMIGMPAPVAVLFTMGGCLLMALPYALAGAVVCKWRQPGMKGVARDAAIFTVAITWLTPVFHGSIAHTQYQFPVVLQITELGGAPLLMFVMFLVNGLIAEGISVFQSQRASAWKSLGFAAGILALVIGYGIVRLKQFDSAMKSAPQERWFIVGAIQPNIPIRVAADRQPAPGASGNNFFTAIEQAKVLAQKHPEIDLLALPENPATFVFNEDAARRQALANLIGETGKPLMLNADAVDTSMKGDVPPRYNVALLMDAERKLANHYPKIKRIPFVEYIPGETKLPWLRKWFPKSQRVLEGTGPVVFEVKPGIRIVPLICYEGTMSGFTREFVRNGGNVIVNQVNDSWFLRTRASEVHMALTLFRAVEFRVPLVRVTNSGTGAHIRADGKIVPGSRTELFTEAATAFPLYIPPRQSVYAKVGNYWMLGFLALLPGFTRNKRNRANEK